MGYGGLGKKESRFGSPLEFIKIKLPLTSEINLSSLHFIFLLVQMHLLQ